MAAPAIIEALRAATSPAHAALDAGVHLDRRVRAPGDRLKLVQAFHRFHASAETLFDRVLGDVEGLDLAARARSPILGADLADLGAAPDRSPDPLEADRSEALGWLYVVEGSSLGGHVITRALDAQGVDKLGLRFLDPYGADVGVRWRDVVAVLDREVAYGRASQARIVAGAQAAFAYACDVLIERGRP